MDLKTIEKDISEYLKSNNTLSPKDKLNYILNLLLYYRSEFYLEQILGRIKYDLSWINALSFENFIKKNTNDLIKNKIIKFGINNLKNHLFDYSEYIKKNITYTQIDLYINNYLYPGETLEYFWMLLAVYFSNTFDEVLDLYYKLTHFEINFASIILKQYKSINNNLISCFVIDKYNENTELETLYEVTNILKSGGGVGLSLDKFNNVSNIIKFYDKYTLYLSNNYNYNNKIAFYMSLWNKNINYIFKYCKESSKKLLNSFFGLWMPSIFIDYVEADKDWYLFDYNDIINDINHYKDKLNTKEFYEFLFTKRNNLGFKIKAKELYYEIEKCIFEKGLPYILFSDYCQEFSNHKNLGSIKCSNLCTEIMQYFGDYENNDKYAECVLGNIILPSCIINKTFDFNKLMDLSKKMVRYLNMIIDNTNKSNKSNLLNLRPIGVGVLGFSNVLFKLGLAIDDPKTKDLNEKIFACIYFSALEESVNLVKKYGKYNKFNDTPFCEGKLQFDLQNKKPIYKITDNIYLDWELLKYKIKENGIANSLLTTIPPTATTAILSGFSDSVGGIIGNVNLQKNINSNINYIYNRELLNDINYYYPDINKFIRKLIYYRGSIQNIDNIPQNIKDVYKTVWEINYKKYLDLFIQRSKYIDQHQSTNIFIKKNENNFYNILKYLKENKYKGLYYTLQEINIE